MKLVILDRDGVINEESQDFIKAPEEWHPLPGSLEAVGKLSRAGWTVVVASNQSGLRRKLLDIGDLNRIHDRMHRALAEVGGRIDAIFICPHLPRDHCRCRKPSTAMLLEIGERLRTPLAGVPFVGDRLNDVKAAREAGALPWLVRTGHGQEVLAGGEDLDDVRVFDDLAAAADTLVRESAG